MKNTLACKFKDDYSGDLKKKKLFSNFQKVYESFHIIFQVWYEIWKKYGLNKFKVIFVVLELLWKLNIFNKFF